MTETWECYALVDHGRDEDGEPILLPCGAPASEKGAGWACEAGHEHLGIEIEWAPWGPQWQREQMDARGEW